MPELANPRLECFAQHAASGKSLTESAKLAGYAEGSAANMGSRIASRSVVAQRIAELKQAGDIFRATGSTGARTNLLRAAAIEDRWNRMRFIMFERAKDTQFADEPGYSTGLLVRTERTTTGKSGVTKEVSFKLDTDLCRELRDSEDLIAVELGQRSKKSESLTRNFTVSVEGQELNRMLKDQFGQLDPGERAALVQHMPALVEIAGETAEPEVIDSVPSAEPED